MNGVGGLVVSYPLYESTNHHDGMRCLPCDIGEILSRDRLSSVRPKKREEEEEEEEVARRRSGRSRNDHRHRRQRQRLSRSFRLSLHS